MQIEIDLNLNLIIFEGAQYRDLRDNQKVTWSTAPNLEIMHTDHKPTNYGQLTITNV